MKFRFASKLDRSWSAALLALLAWAVVASSEARAGCSHYVRHRAGEGTFRSFIDPLVLGHSDLLTSEADPIQEPFKPCSGPSCSGYPGEPAAPPLAISLEVKPWAYLATPLPPMEAGVAFLAQPAGNLRPVQAGSGIFHPPRPL